jgi:hypothetical protein
MERLCGILLLQHLIFVHPELTNQFSESSSKFYSGDKVFSLDTQIEEFYWPKWDYNLTVYELKQLKTFSLLKIDWR